MLRKGLHPRIMLKIFECCNEQRAWMRLVPFYGVPVPVNRDAQMMVAGSARQLAWDSKLLDWQTSMLLLSISIT